MKSPYSELPARAFWRSAVTERAPLDPGDLYRPKFPINRQMAIVTAGSCFAQHVGRTLRNAEFNVIDAEPLPDAVDDATAHKFGYRLYSARYGNVYTTRQLVQMMQEARGEITPAEPVWEKNGRFYDAQRPNVEPDGLESPELVLAHRKRHLKLVTEAYTHADIVVFTFGLTEAWIHKASGTVYPTAPGTIAGTFDPEVYAFKNYRYDEVIADFETFRSMMMSINPDIKFIITTSPVPLTATASGQHVEVATAYSKAVLRSVCGALYEAHDNVDYFPSYEIITSTNNRGVYFESNKRSVSADGVAAAMALFLQAHGAAKGRKPKGAGGKKAKAAPHAAQADDAVCEDALLEGFAD